MFCTQVKSRLDLIFSIKGFPMSEILVMAENKREVILSKN